MRRCTRCPFEGSDDEFGIKIRSKANDTGVCKKCKAAYNASWYERNKTRHCANVKKNNRTYNKLSQVEIEKIKDRPCSDCGGRFPHYVMDFDHLDGTTKKFSIGKRGSRTWRSTLEEIKKCEVVCSNCHRIRTYQRAHALVA